MKIHRFREHATDYELSIHLDETKVLEDGTPPDPAWCAETRWGKEEPKRADETTTQFAARQKAHRDMIQLESALLAKLELSRRVGGEGTAVAGREGATV